MFIRLSLLNHKSIWNRQTISFFKNIFTSDTFITIIDSIGSTCEPKNISDLAVITPLPQKDEYYRQMYIDFGSGNEMAHVSER